MSLRMIALTGLVMIGAACASGGGRSARRAACVLPAKDSVFARSGPVFQDCGVDRVARRMPTRAHADFRPTARTNACYAADVEFVVDTAGKPEVDAARLVRSTDPAYGESVLALVSQWKYEPALRDGMRVRQIVTERERMTVQVVVVRAGSTPNLPSPVRPPC